LALLHTIIIEKKSIVLAQIAKKVMENYQCKAKKSAVL
jgi:hypothetical protein